MENFSGFGPLATTKNPLPFADMISHSLFPVAGMTNTHFLGKMKKSSLFFGEERKICVF